MKGKFGLVVLFGLFLVSCGNSFYTKSSKGDGVNVTLQIPSEVLTTLASRDATGTTAEDENFLEVSLFVNDDEPITRSVSGFTKAVTIPFQNIRVGSRVKAKANLTYKGQDYTGETRTAVVSSKGTKLTLILRSKDASEDDVFVDSISGEISINESKLSFIPWHHEEGSTAPVRFITTVSLESILGDKHLSDGDTLVFVLTSEQEESNIFTMYGVNQFYYQLQDENWQSKDDTALYQNNNCINFEQPDVNSGKRNYYFVMPLNLIKNPKNYKNIQFFFDVDKIADAPDELDMECSVSYTILPASQKAFVFGVGKNWDAKEDGDPAYRYEFNLPLEVNNQKCDFSGGETVEVTLSGNVFLYKKNEVGFQKTNFSTEDYPLFGEIYDGAGYDSKNEKWYSFHPLSNDQGYNKKDLQITEGVFDSGSTYRFGSIQSPFFDLQDGVNPPPDFPHDYKFQCTRLCSDPLDILLIQNFGMVTTVTPGN